MRRVVGNKNFVAHYEICESTIEVLCGNKTITCRLFDLRSICIIVDNIIVLHFNYVRHIYCDELVEFSLKYQYVSSMTCTSSFHLYCIDYAGREINSFTK